MENHEYNDHDEYDEHEDHGQDHDYLLDDEHDELRGATIGTHEEVAAGEGLRGDCLEGWKEPHYVLLFVFHTQLELF